MATKAQLKALRKKFHLGEFKPKLRAVRPKKRGRSVPRTTPTGTPAPGWERRMWDPIGPD